MQYIKKITVYVALCLHFQLAHSQQEQCSEFYNPKIYTYTKEVINFPSKKGTAENLPIIISDTTIHDYFTTRKTRKLIIETTHGNTTTATIEIWTTKNPSYLTWQNAALISVLATTAIGSSLFYNSYYRIHELLQASTKSEVSSQARQDNTPTDTTAQYPLIKQWIEFAFSQNELSPKQIEQKHAIETMPEFKKNLEDVFTDTIDFNAPDDKNCSFCTMLREAYGRTAEDNNIPNYFD